MSTTKTPIAKRIGRTVRKRLGLGHTQRIRVRVQFDIENAVDRLGVGPFVKTEFPTECAECGEPGHYFHEYNDHTGLISRTRLRCHECETGIHGNTRKVPVLNEDGEVSSEPPRYEVLNPRDMFEGGQEVTEVEEA